VVDEDIIINKCEKAYPLPGFLAIDGDLNEARRYSPNFPAELSRNKLPSRIYRRTICTDDVLFGSSAQMRPRIDLLPWVCHLKEFLIKLEIDLTPTRFRDEDPLRG
jgi:hypothetical protein